MLCLGITGGIGSGKSYLSHIFTALGIPVYDADLQAKILYNRNQGLRLSLIELLGADIYYNGVLQREIMAERIFSIQSLLEEVNKLVHPVVMDDFFIWKECQKTPYVILESAIILETPFASAIDKMLTVSAPGALRLERLCRRDVASAEDAQRRMEKQWSDEMREAKSHFVVFSDGKKPLLPQVLKIHHSMIKLNMQRGGCS